MTDETVQTIGAEAYTESDDTTEIKTITMTDQHIRDLRELWCQPHLRGASITLERQGALADLGLVIGHDLTDIGHQKCHDLIASGAWRGLHN